MNPFRGLQGRKRPVAKTHSYRDFQVMAKPIGALCNMNCHYCYYLKKKDLYPDSESFQMPERVLESYIIQHIQASGAPVVNFEWHGGEPTLLGLDYFRTIVSLQRKHKPPGQHITNGIQTNGTLLDDAWCRFLTTERFSVGISLDGPRELHDPYRVTKGGQPTHKQAVHGVRLLQQHGVRYDILCSVHHRNVHYATAVYRFFKDIGARHLQFLPVVEHTNDTSTGVTPETVPAEAYGAFLCTVFDEWARSDIGRITVQIFDEAARPDLGVEHSICIFRETCGNVPVVEHNGDFYSCDHFVNPDHYLGNIVHTPLVEMLQSAPQKRFGDIKGDSLPRYCKECEVRMMCNGGCPKDRFIQTPDGEDGLNYLCAGLKRFFIYSRPSLLKLMAVSRLGQPIERFMELRQTAVHKVFPNRGRNDPCPCGSGLKYKKCCLGKTG